MRSAGDIDAGNRTGWGARIDYPNDRWDCRAQTFHLGDALDPALGFISRPGTRRYVGGCDFQPRPSPDGRWSFIRQHFFSIIYDHVNNFATGETESWRVNLTPLDAQLESGGQISIFVRPQGERLLEPFEISEGVILPVGSYQFNRYRFQFTSSSHRSVSVETVTEFGDFYNGSLLVTSGTINWTSPEGTLQSSLTAEQNFAKLAQGNFVQRLWQLNLAYGFSPNLILTSFIQYDSESDNLGQNTRLRWTIQPGNDLFLVWNRGWKRSIRNRDDLSLTPDTETIAMKLRWTFRL